MAKVKSSIYGMNEILDRMATPTPTPMGASIQAPQAPVQYARPEVTPLTYGQPVIGRQPQGAMSNDPSDKVVPSVMTPAANKAEAFSDILNIMGKGQSPITIPYKEGIRPPTYDEQLSAFTEGVAKNKAADELARSKGELDKAAYVGGIPKVQKITSSVPIEDPYASYQPAEGQLTAWAEERPSAPSPWPGEGRQPQAVPETARNMDDILAALAINLVPAIAGNLMDPGAGYNPAIGTGLAGTQFLIKGRLDEEAAAREKEALDKKLAAEAEQNKAKMEYEYKFEKFKKDLEKDSGQDAEKFQWYDPKEKLWKWGWSPKKIDFSKDAESQTKLTNIAVKPEELEKNKSVPRLIVDEVTGYKRWAMPPTGMKPGEIRSVRGGGKQSTGGQTAGGQSVVPQLTPNQKKDVDRQLPQFLRETAKQRSAYYAANQILNTINSGLAISSIPVELARAAGEVGALSKDDVNRWKGSRALLDRVEQVFKEITTGQLTEKNKQLYKEYAEILMKKNSEIINQTKKAYSESISASNKADPRAVDAILDPHVSRFIAPAKPTAEMSKEERAKEFERFKTMYGKKKE